VLIGFNEYLLHVYRTGFNAFKELILTDVQKLQEGVSAGEQADTRNVDV
jgi:hypothetical protein